MEDPECESRGHCRTAAGLWRLLRREGIPEYIVAMGFQDPRNDRRHFVLPEHKAQAYYNQPLSIGYDVTISQPYIVGKMLHLLDVRADSRVLELGTGSAYNAAVLSSLIPYGQLVTVERVSPLARRAQQLLKNRPNVEVVEADALSVSRPGQFDRLIATAEFLDQTAVNQFLGRFCSPQKRCVAVYPFQGQLYVTVRDPMLGSSPVTRAVSAVRFVKVLPGTRQT